MQAVKKQVRMMTNSERGNSVTAVVCVSAAGFYVLPMLIYKRKRMKPEMTNSAPPGTVFITQEKGWCRMEVFVDWLKHFIKVVKPSKQSKVLLILGHVTHAKNLAAIYLVHDAGVHMVLLLTHKLLLLGVAFLGHLVHTMMELCSNGCVYICQDQLQLDKWQNYMVRHIVRQHL